MMSGRNSLRDSFVGGRNFPATSLSQQHRRGRSLTGFSRDTDENLDLFSKNRHSLSVTSSDESSDVSVKLGRLSVGSAKVAKSGADDLLSSTDGGKHDYDWLLTPPGTPLFPTSDGSESQPATAAPRSSSLARSASSAKASRLSASPSDGHQSTRPTRSSSVTRPSLSSSQYSTYSSNRSSILNTSSASVSSYTRPSSPISRTPARPSTPSSARPSTPSSARPTTPSSRPSVSRSSTPSRVRSAPANNLTDRTRPSQSSRPSTPSSRAQIPASTNSTVTRSNSRPSTPTRRNPVTSASLTPASGSSTSARGVLSNGRNPAPTSRPSSPGPRLRSPQQPVVPPDFPLDTPPNLRTTLPDRPLSAGRSRPGAALTMKGNPESTIPGNVPRRHSSPIVSRGRLTDPSGKSRAPSNGHVSDTSEPRRASHVSDSGMRKPIRSSTTTSDSNGFGRTISKKSLDMAIRHMDIRNGTGSTRALSGTTLFPQSIRSSSRAQSVRSASAPESISNGDILENGNHISRAAEIASKTNGRHSAKLYEVDVYESSRYDALLLKEDLKNTNWLHSIDDKSDQGSIFDNGFESLPEPFGLL